MAGESPLRLLVADDESLARDLVRGYVSADPNVAIVGECASGDDVARALGQIDADVLLLDVRMPGSNVFSVLEEAASRGRTMPAVIFSTAYDNYAVRAFELNAVDYLVKPYTSDRLAEALRRVRSRQAVERDASLRAIPEMQRAPTRPHSLEATRLHRLNRHH